MVLLVIPEVANYYGSDDANVDDGLFIWLEELKGILRENDGGLLWSRSR